MFQSTHKAPDQKSDNNTEKREAKTSEASADLIFGPRNLPSGGEKAAQLKESNEEEEKIAQPKLNGAIQFMVKEEEEKLRK